LGLLLVLMLCASAGADYWFAADDGSDANDGLDMVGSGLQDGTYTVTAGVGYVVDTPSNGYLAGYSAGNLIYLKDNSTPAEYGWYTVTAYTDQNNIQVNPTPVEGPGITSGQDNIYGSDGPKLTIAAAEAEAASGDTIWLAAGDTFQEAFVFCNLPTFAIRKYDPTGAGADPIWKGLDQTSTCDGAPVFGGANSTVTVDDAIFDEKQIGCDVAITGGVGSPYTMLSVTSPTICVVVGNASAAADEAAVSLSAEYLFGAAGTTAFTMQSIHLRRAGNVRACYVQNNTLAATFTDCTFDADGADSFQTLRVLNSALSTGSLTVDGCTFAGGIDPDHGYITVRRLDTLEVTDCSFTGEGVGVWLEQEITTANIHDNTGLDDLDGRFVLVDANWTGQGHVIVKDNTGVVSGFIQVAPNNPWDDTDGVAPGDGSGKWVSFWIEGNTIARKGDGDNLYTLVSFGVDVPTDTNAIGRIVVKDNKFSGETCDDSHDKHLTLFGGGVTSAEIVGNRFYDTNTGNQIYGLVAKGRHMNIHHNMFYGVRCLYLSGAKDCQVQHNSFVGTTSGVWCIGWSYNTPGDDRVPFGNVITDNIFEAQGTNVACLYDADGVAYRIRSGYNLFYTPGTGADAAYLDNTSYTTLSALRTKWGTYEAGTIGETNDANSIEGDPRFRSVTGDADADDWRIHFGSPARGASSVEYMDIGAVQRRETSPVYWLRPW